MSTTVSATPITLLFTIGTEVIRGMIDLNTTSETHVHLNGGLINELCKKEFETNILDKDTLIKTLLEHGATNIIEAEGDISCECDSFFLDFHHMENKPYRVSVSYKEEFNLQTLISDIGSEYTINAQEVSYNTIKERLNAQNLSIENEEIYEDNTIVLTVNLE